MQVNATPPPPPPLAGTLANKTVAQLLQLFTGSTALQQNNFLPSLLATTARLTNLNAQNSNSSSLSTAKSQLICICVLHTFIMHYSIPIIFS